MSRRVLYDTAAPAATAAASRLGDEFTIEPLPAGPLVDDPHGAVILVGSRATPARPRVETGPRARVIGLVDGAAPGPWPEDWYAILPADAGRAVLLRAVRNAFADLDAAAEIARLGRELSELNAIGVRLSSERDPGVLLEMILRKAREITLSDAGSLYLVEEGPDGARRLRFALTQNDSMAVPFHTTTLPLSRESLAGYVALEGRPLNLDDAYALPPGSPFRINRAFDAEVGYRTRSMLVVPMQTPQGEIIGVVQLINCKPALEVRLRSVEDTERLVVPFSPRFVALASSLASQAAVALANSRLYESVRQLFEGFVRASVTAIESRDPTTAGHSFRVADLTVGLAQAVDRCGRGPYAALRVSGDEIVELRYAALLHDFGKVGVREHVLVKAKKLYPDGLERIQSRAEIIRRGIELRATRRKLQYLVEKGARHYEAQATMLEAELAASLAELDEALARIEAVNEPSVLPHVTGVETSVAVEEIRRLAERLFEDHLGNRQALITADEAEALAVSRGSLTPDEYRQIRAHVVHTWEFLVQIPWTREFRRIPEIARSHHEKLDGSGYPQGLTAAEIPVQSRMMTIADIYDALTAFDRPYKAAVPPETALDILDRERRAGHIDTALLDLFIGARVWELTRRDRR